MYQYRVTKYNPIYRDNNGLYKVEEWTSVSDIGKFFNGNILTKNQYFNMEMNYINFICNLLRMQNINQLKIAYIENHQNKKITFDVNEYLNIPILKKTIQMILREEIWCKFETNNFFLHFGYDFYMYIGCMFELDEISSFANQYGLFAEAFQSPYL